GTARRAADVQHEPTACPSVQAMSGLGEISRVCVSEGGLEPPRRWYIPESGIYHQSKLTHQGRPPWHFVGQERRRCREAQRPGPRELRKRRAVSRNSAAGPGGPRRAAA